MRKSMYFVLVAILIATLALSACQPAPTPAPEAPKATEAPAAPAAPAEPEEPAAPAESKLGTPDMPIIMAMAPSATSQELQAGGEAIAQKLSELTGLSIKTTIPNSYAALIEAMGSDNAHIGWLPPFAYLLAKEKGFADVGLVTVRYGSDHYGVQFVAARASGFTTYYDQEKKETTADAATALKQFEGKKPCWVDELSASGYVLPDGALKKEGITTTEPAFVGKHPLVISSLYNGGTCDFGATYIDARTDKSLADLTDVMDKVDVIWVTPPVIPNDNVSYASNLPDELKTKLTDALVELASNEEGQTLLKNGGYQVESLKVVDDTFYDEFRVYLQAAGVDLTKLVK